MGRERDISKLAFVISLIGLTFLAGMICARKRIFPYPLLDRAIGEFHDAWPTLRQSRPALLLPIQFEGEGVTLNKRSEVQPGFTLVQGIFAEGVQLLLLDMGGEVVHRWNVDFFEIWPDPEHIIPRQNIPKTVHNYHTHGMWAFPDGSVIFNVAEKGTAKLDKCGEVVWTVDRMTHHSVTPNPDGSFWIPAKGDISKMPDELMLPGISREDLLSDSKGWYEDVMLLVSSEGEIKKEISVLQALFTGGFERELFESSLLDAEDPTHINDIEVVTPALADKIDGVQPGDLLISIRNLNMLAILSASTGKVVWHQVGSWWRQHDPDIMPDGNILLFNNSPPNFGINRVEGSNIISFDPATGESSIVYPKSPSQAFFTKIMGTQQKLKNGNLLITQTMAGRVFEVNDEGETVWEYVMPFDKTHSALMESAIRYDENYFEVEDWRCVNDRG